MSLNAAQLCRWKRVVNNYKINFKKSHIDILKSQKSKKGTVRKVCEKFVEKEQENIKVCIQGHNKLLSHRSWR
jgi:hypothetical protein